jgi:protocatechuate 3,4-dioxygenase, beta subunit
MQIPRMQGRLFAVAVLFLAVACQAREGEDSSRVARPSGQLPQIPGCEGCEAAWERDPATLSSTIRLAAPNEPGERLVISGTVFRHDGKTPAPGVVLYLHHTNAEGVYGNGSNESEWSRRHGRLRGWLKTGPDGRYTVHTIKPAPYPGRNVAAHIHLTVLEPGRTPYWIDDIVFEGEPWVDREYLASRQNRGGRGVVRLSRHSDGTWVARRDVILEK